LAILLLVMIAGLAFLVAELLNTSFRYNGGISGNDIRFLFMMFSYGLYLSAVLLVPPMAGVSICSEKQQDSYDLLLMTYIQPRSLALAKLLNVLGIYALVALATLPIVGVFFFFVGVDWPQLVASGAIIAVSALSCAVVGLLCSAWFFRTMTAIIATYITIFFLHGGFLIVMAIVSELLLVDTQLGYLLSDLFEEEFVLGLAPPIAFAMIGDGFSSTVDIVVCILFHGAIIFAAYRLTLRVLAKPPRPMLVVSEKPIDSQEQLDARRKQFPFYLLDPRRRRPAIPDGKSPILSKERQTGLLGRGTFAIRVFYGFTIFCFVISLFSIMANNYSSQYAGSFNAWPILFDTILVLIVTPTLVATTMAKEYEWGNMDMLRMTLLSPAELVVGKFKTACLTAALPVAGAMLGCLPPLYFTYRFAEGWAGLASGFGNMVICSVYALALSMLVTVNCRRTLTALMLAYAACIGALLIAPMTIGILWDRVAGRSSDEEAGLIFFLSPILAQVFNLIESQTSNEKRYLLNTYWLANMATFAAVSAGLLVLARYRFAAHLARGKD